MTWQEKLNTDFSITTGDGKKYTPLWIPSSKEIEYNVAIFEFPNTEGALVRREMVKGTRYDLDFAFTGENHLEVSKTFEVSAKDKRVWTIVHPFYGQINVHPVGFKIDNSQMNITRYSGVVIETISDVSPKTTFSYEDKIKADKIKTDELLSTFYAKSVTPKAADVKNMSDKNKLLFNIGAKGLINTADSDKYFSLFESANSAILNATTNPMLAIQQMQAMLNAPFTFSNNVQNRIEILLAQLLKLGDSVSSIIGYSSKKLYESMGGTLVGATVVAAITNSTYKTREDVLITIASIIRGYNIYTANLDVMQSVNGNADEAYIAESVSIIELSSLVSYSVSVLFSLATNARQTRHITVAEDSNVFLLAKKLYGLKDDDSTLEELIDVNQIGINELLVIKKGRNITYYA